MNIILCPGPAGRSRSIRCGRWHYLVALSFMLALITLGYLAGDGDWLIVHIERAPVVEARPSKADLQRAQVQIETLTLQLGYLQARVDRLDALGYRLVALANLDESEFDFAAPALGGRPAPILNAIPYGDILGRVDAIAQTIDRLAARIEKHGRQLRVLDGLMLSYALHEELYPAGRPVGLAWISSAYGKRDDPFSGRPEFHTGIDFAAAAGSEIIAVAGGMVTFAGPRYSYGNLVEIDHGSGLVTRYAHNHKLLVTSGERVTKGQTIALMGSSGRSTGPHLHFEVLKDGKHVNPGQYIQMQGD